MNLVAKGYLVVGQPVQIEGISYCGVETDAWPIGFQFSSELATNIYEMSFLDMAFPLLVDYDSALHYCCECEREGIEPRILFCEILSTYQPEKAPWFESLPVGSFLGFDYAYPSGDYYSAVANDVIYRANILPTCWKYHLNEFGLFASRDELLQFVEERLRVANACEENNRGCLFEKGTFVGYRVFCVDYMKTPPKK